MKNKVIKTICLFMLFAVLPFYSYAWAGNLSVSESAITEAIENRAPVGVSESFDSSVNKLFAFTKIINITQETKIIHKWFYNDKIMAEIPLTIKPPNWRTYSSKKIRPDWKGEWKVDIFTQEGTHLKTLNFLIK